MPLFSERRRTQEMKEAQTKARIEAEEDAEREFKRSGYQTKEMQRLQARKTIIQRKEDRLALKQRELELKTKEREFKHPVRTRAVRRAEKMAGLGVDRVQQTASTATRVAGGRLREVASRAKVSPTTRRLPREKPGRTRLPVFQEGAPSFAERIALDFGTKQPQDILPGQQQQEITSRPADLFGINKQYDLGIGNGNKKKVRYY